jgi:sigma-B regulation protein RsbU (phosphoserine phosphatase)
MSESPSRGSNDDRVRGANDDAASGSTDSGTSIDEQSRGSRDLPLQARASDAELLSTLFELGREVTSVLDLDELLAKIPQLIARLTRFNAFSVYLLDEGRQELRIAYAVGYPQEIVTSVRLRLGQGVVGAAVQQGRPILVNDVREDPRWVRTVPTAVSQLAVPLRRKGRVIGALNLLSEHRGAFTSQDEALLRQFGAHVAVAIENARLFESERHYVATLETLAEIGREVSSILDLDQLLTRIAGLTKRLIDYRTFGILLLDEETEELEMKLAVRYGDEAAVGRIKLGDGLVGWTALHREPVLVPDVSKDPRYIPAVQDVRSELVIPMLLKDRCIGVFDLESPELDAFTKEHAELLTLLASQAAVAIENARLYEHILRNEERMEKELRFAQRVQMALMPDVPFRVEGADVAGRFASARELGGDLHDFLFPDPNSLVVAVGDVSGKGVPAALYGAFAGELVRSRTFRRRYAPERFSVTGVLEAMNNILHERQLEEYYCTLCYALFDLKRQNVVLANSGLPYPVRCSGDDCGQIVLPGMPLGSFAGVTYDQATFPTTAGDVYVFCTDGIFEAFNEQGVEFGTERLLEVVREARQLPASGIVDAIFDAVRSFRGDAPQSDDMTAVAVRIRDS